MARPCSFSQVHNLTPHTKAAQVHTDRSKKAYNDFEYCNRPRSETIDSEGQPLTNSDSRTFHNPNCACGHHDRPTRTQPAPRVLQIVWVVSAVAATAGAVGMAAQTIVRRRADDGPDTPVVAIRSPPNELLSQFGWRRPRNVGHMTFMFNSTRNHLMPKYSPFRECIVRDTIVWV